VKEFVLDASFSLCWCFHEEATAKTYSLLTALQNQEAISWVPLIWQFEMLNALGKGVMRGRVGKHDTVSSKAGRRHDPSSRRRLMGDPVRSQAKYSLARLDSNSPISAPERIAALVEHGKVTKFQ
jgi:hypothetical protein